MGNRKDERIRIIALTFKGEGKSSRVVAKQLGISKSTVARWFKEADDAAKANATVNPGAKEAEAIAQARSKNVMVSDRYSEYVDTLKTIKDRQGKWAGSVTETGVRSLKFANKFLAVVERKQSLDKLDLELVKLIPSLISASTAAIKSAAEAEDRAYSLELLLKTLSELPQQVQTANRSPNTKTMVADD